MVVWSTILCWRRKYYKDGNVNAFREIMRVEVVRNFWNIIEISDEWISFLSVSRVLQNSWLTLVVKDLEKKLCRRSLLSKVESGRPTDLLKTNSFTGKEPFNNAAKLLRVRVLTFCYKALRKDKRGWGFILSASYVTPIFFNFALFDGVLSYVPLKFFTQQAFIMILVETIEIYPRLQTV